MMRGTARESNETGCVVFCDIRATDEFGVVRLSEEQATEPWTLGEEEWQDAQDIAEFVKSRNDQRSFFSWGLFGLGVTDATREGYFVKYSKEFDEFCEKRDKYHRPKDFLPCLRAQMEKGQAKFEVHSLGLILPTCTTSEAKEIIRTETESEDFSLFAAALTLRFASSSWHVPDASKNFCFQRCLMEDIRKDPVPYEDTIDVFEFPVFLPFRERFGWFANHCEKQLRFIQAHALGHWDIFKPRVLYFGPDKDVTNELNIEAIDLQDARRRILEKKLKRKGWKRVGDLRWRKESLFLLISVGGNVLDTLKCCLENLLTYTYKVMPVEDVINLRGVQKCDEIIAFVKKEFAKKIDLRDNGLSWDKDGKYLEELTSLELSLLETLDLSSNSLFGTKFMTWLFDFLQKHKKVTVDISETPQAKGWTCEAWQVFKGFPHARKRVVTEKK